MSGPKWRETLARAGHKFVCWKCEMPFKSEEQFKHVHDGKYSGERLESEWKVPYAIIDREPMTIKQFEKRTGWKTGEPIGMIG